MILTVDIEVIQLYMAHLRNYTFFLQIFGTFNLTLIPLYRSLNLLGQSVLLALISLLLLLLLPILDLLGSELLST